MCNVYLWQAMKTGKIVVLQSLRVEATLEDKARKYCYMTYGYYYHYYYTRKLGMITSFSLVMHV